MSSRISSRDGAGAVGYGVPLNIDRRTGVALKAVNLPLHDVHFPNRARELYGLPAGVENDGNAAALAEWRLGAGRDVSNLIMLTLGTGVGGGIVIDDHLYRGWAELGHTVVIAGGQPCQGNCHGHGHVEAHASGHAANRAAVELYGRGADAPVLLAKARDGDPRAIDALAEIGRILGAAIGSWVNIFDPDIVVVGGGFGAAAGDLLLEPARASAAGRGAPARRRDAADRRGRARRRGRPDRGRARRVRGARRAAVTLALCATPIGNLADVTLRVLEELAAADVVLCEDTRHTRILLERHGVRARPLSYHRHNEAARVAELVPRLVAGERMALVSDAGLPGVNDPGARLVAAAREAGVAVTVLPGPSAVETALVASGLAGEQYRFLGYVPRSERERAELWRELSAWRHPTVAFESPKRLSATLASLAAADSDRLVAVCRELTKLHEEIVCGTAASLAERFREPPRGEVTLVIGGATARTRDRRRCGGRGGGGRSGRADRRGRAAQGRCGRRRAPDGVARNALYNRSL